MTAIDEALEENVIVSGALPPEGKDLDLVITRQQARALPGLLAGLGFLPRGPAVAPVRLMTRQWVRIDGRCALAVDLNPMQRWNLDPAEERALAADAVPVGKYRHLVRPSPHHTLLILARNLAAGPLPARRLGKIDAALQADPLAWQRAQDRARAWGAGTALQALRRLHDDGHPPSRLEQARSVLEVARLAGVRGMLGRVVRRLSAARPRRPAVVGFSGLDGSGKSSQARELDSLLRQLGVAVVTEWKPLGHNRSIRAIRRAAKRVLAMASGLDAGQLERSKQPGRSLLAGASPALLGGRQNRMLTHAWATVVCLASAGHYRMVALKHAASGRLIVFDRFALDTMAQLRFFYGPGAVFGLQRILIKILCPAPAAAWLLDVPAEVALARKAEQYDLAQLRQQEALLREEAARLGVMRLDGTRPMAELHREIATEVWRRMGR